MSDFEKRKKEYLENLRKNVDLIGKMKFKEKNPGDALKMKEVVLDPKNEGELITAIVALDFTDLVERAKMGLVKTIPPENNYYIYLLASMINAFKKGEDVEHIVEEAKNNPVKYLYSFIVGIIADSDASIEYLAEVTGYDLYDELESEQLQLYLEKANCVFSKDSDNQEGMLFNGHIEAKEIEEARKMCDEFHKLCEDGKFKNIERRYLI